jgi:hypothetical protein
MFMDWYGMVFAWHIMRMSCAGHLLALDRPNINWAGYGLSIIWAGMALVDVGHDGHGLGFSWPGFVMVLAVYW